MTNDKKHIKKTARRIVLWGLFAAILLLAPTPASAQSARVSINIKSGKLTTLFDQIQKKSGYKVFYSDNVVDANRIINITVSNTAVSELLGKILPQLGLSYKFIDNTIVLSRIATDNNPNGQMAVAKPVRRVTGVVRDDRGDAVIGATVMASKDPRRGTATGVDGSFAFNVAIEESALVISMIGMETQRVNIVNDKANVKLKSASIEGEALVVTGFVPKVKNSFTGTATQVSGEKLLSISPTNTLDALKVFDPSFSIPDINGVFGSDPNRIPDRIEIRGANSMPEIDITEGTLKTYTSLPVFIMDGFQVSVDDVYNLDINRVESVTILKDAAASSIYGSRAANGVVVIATKMPKQGSIQIAYTFNGNVSAPDLSSYNLMNSRELVQYYKKMDMFPIAENGNPDLANMLKIMEMEANNGVDTYWLSQPLRTAFSHDHSIILEGGAKVGGSSKNRSVRYSVNLNAKLKDGVMKGSFRNSYGGGTKLIYDTRNLQFTSDIQVNFIKAEDSPYGNFGDYTRLLPIFRIQDANGNFYPTLTLNNAPMYGNFPWTDEADTRLGRQINPLYEATKLNSFSGNDATTASYRMGANWEIIPDLRAQASFMVDYTETNTQKYVSPVTSSVINDKDNSGNTIDHIYRRGSYNASNSSAVNYYGKVHISYLKSLGKNTVQAVAGGELRESNRDSYGFSNTGFLNDMLNFPSAAAQYPLSGGPTGNGDIVRTAGFFSTLNYSYDNRYMVDGSFRLDASSNFASKQRVSSFWAVGARWNINNEKFMDKKVFSQLALKANIGTTGNSNFALSQILSMYKYLGMYEGITGAELLSLANPNLKWQTSLQRNIGIELGILKNVVNMEFNYYYNTTKDNITQVSILPSTGFSTYMANQGDVLNRGFEFNLSVTPYRDSNWQVNLFVNGRHNRNKLVKISESLKKYNEDVMNKQSASTGTKIKTVFLFEEGKSLSTIYAVPSLGIDPATGQEIFVKKSGERTFVWDAADQIRVGDTEPTLSGYFGINLNYRRWSLNSSLEYSFGGDLYNQTLIDRIENPSMSTSVNPMAYNMDRRALYERWSKPGDIARYRGVKGTSTVYASSRFVQKNNFVRMNSLKVMYTLTKPDAKILGLSMVRLSVSTNDLFYLSTINIERGLSYPFAREFYLSLQANF